jgi:FliI/YscN family ATPase
VHRLLGAIAECHGLFAPVGARCEIVCRSGVRVPAEVVGFRDEHALVAPVADTRGIAAGDRVEYCGQVASVRVGDGLLGRVIDADGAAIDSREPRVPGGVEVALAGRGENPLARQPVDRVLVTGIRAIDGLFTVGRGQRLGIFAGSGVGKSMLLGMLARNVEAPVVVVGLIGERSREVRDFVDNEITEAGRRRAVVVVATAEEPALRRLQAALTATSVAEYFRDRGEHVVLLLDSLTRVAMAQREIGLSMGEPPTTKGYPPSMFSLLPRLLERAGCGQRGSITGFYAVLVESDDRNDPVVDCVRAVLDGHLWLSRELAERGHYPAIDPLASLSRVQPRLIDREHAAAVRLVRADLARYRDAEELIRLGAYVAGRDPPTDAAVRRMPAIELFLRQEREEVARFDDTVRALRSVSRDPVEGGAPAVSRSGCCEEAACR